MLTFCGVFESRNAIGIPIYVVKTFKARHIPCGAWFADTTMKLSGSLYVFSAGVKIADLYLKETGIKMYPQPIIDDWVFPHQMGHHAPNQCQQDEAINGQIVVTPNK